MTHSDDDESEISAEESRARSRDANRNLALLLVGGALAMLVAAFGVAILVTHV